MVSGEFLVVSSWVGVFLDVFGVPLWFLVLLAILRCSLKVLGVLKIFGVVPSWSHKSNNKVGLLSLLKRLF